MTREDYLMSIEQVAQGYKVPEEDVLDLIEEGHLGSTLVDGVKHVPLSEYQRLGKSLAPALMSKINARLWDGIRASHDEVREDVRARFAASNEHILNRAEKAISLMQEIHARRDAGIDVVNGQNAGIAAFVVFARVISNLWSIVSLLRSGVPSEAVVLFRPLAEGSMLAKYFFVSHATGENEEIIKKWFAGDYVKAKRVRAYLAKRMGYPEETLAKVYEGYSRALHYNYRSIMESYRGMSMSGFGETRTERFGFDYHKSSHMRDVVEYTRVFEELLLGTLLSFKICFSQILSLDDDEQKRLDQEIEFYERPSGERIEEILRAGE